MKETTIEKYFVRRVAKKGGLTYKLEVPGQRGLLDRLAVLPGGRILFVELKRPKGGRVSAVQHVTLERLRALGAEAHVARTKEEIDALLR